MLLMAIDPGTTHSAFVLLETETNDIIDAGLMENGNRRHRYRHV